VRDRREAKGATGADLMRAFARRDPRAADELYARFSPRVYGLGMVMLGNAAQAEDLVQDTFVKVWRKAESYDPSRGSVDTWVLLIARSLAVDLIRRRVLETRILASQETPEVTPEPGPEERAESRDLADRARQEQHGGGRAGRDPRRNGQDPDPHGPHEAEGSSGGST
jgi:DNA-directed RNA polymerase specialized sigma24 family protein